MKVYVRKDDIAKWMAGEPCNCPIKAALIRKTRRSWIVGYTRAINPRTNKIHYFTEQAREFVDAVDMRSGKPPKPGWVEVWK